MPELSAPRLRGRFVTQMIRREARSSLRALVLYGSCVALGIAALVGLHGLRATTSHALDAQSRLLLGADLRLSGRGPIEGEDAAAITRLAQKSGVAITRATRFGSMAMARGSGHSRLVDIHSVASDYPLYGDVVTEPAGRFATLHAESTPAAIVDPSLLIQLDTAIGDELVIGEVAFTIRGTIEKAPGGIGMQTQIAPRVLIPDDQLEATRLILPGSLVEYLVFINMGREELGPWLQANRARLADAHIRIQTVASYQRDLNRSFGVMTRYLGLVGLAALALGGVGVAAGIRVFVREKLESVALLRSLGAGSREIFIIYGVLALSLGAVSGLVGSSLGVALQWGLPYFMGGLLPVEIPVRFEPMSVVTGLVLGLWVTLLFAAGPLIDLLRVSPLRALRADFAREKLPVGGRVALVVALLASLVVISIWQAPRWIVGLAFAGGLSLALATLAGTAFVAMRWLRSHPISRLPFWLRQGIANLFRPRNHTLASVLTIGFGLFLVATLHGVQFNVMQQLAVDSRPDRPNLVLFDVQPDQVAPIEAQLASRNAQIRDRAPLISARIAALGGQSIADRLAADPDNRPLRWALQREYRLTIGAEPRETETLVAGRWWSEGAGDEEPIPVSLETSIRDSLGLAVGDHMTWDIQGVPIASVVASVRKVDWGRMATNFFVVFPPGLIEQAPQTTVMLAHLSNEDARAALQRDLVREFPNISVLDATVILRALDTMMSRIAVAVRVLSLFTLATGFMILVAATVTAREERAKEVLLLRTLGASTGTLRRILTTEVLALGGLAAGVGSSIALLASWGLVRYVFELPFEPPLRDVALLAAATLAMSAMLGALGGRDVRASSPLAGLRRH
jgi:putative ABC transport system permease protein